jgi:hypothetical protein
VAGGPLSFVPEPVMPSCPSLHARRTARVQPGAAYVGPGAAAPNWRQISRMASAGRVFRPGLGRACRPTRHLTRPPCGDSALSLGVARHTLAWLGSLRRPAAAS